MILTKPFILLFFFIAISIAVSSQTETEGEINGYYLPQTYPMFKDCENIVDDPDTELYNELVYCCRDNWREQFSKFKYPENCDKGFWAKIYVYFSVDENGKICDINPVMVSSSSEDDNIIAYLKEEAIRVFESMPAFVPYQKDGRNFKVVNYSRIIMLKY